VGDPPPSHALPVEPEIRGKNVEAATDSSRISGSRASAHEWLARRSHCGSPDGAPRTRPGPARVRDKPSTASASRPCAKGLPSASQSREISTAQRAATAASATKPWSSSGCRQSVESTVAPMLVASSSSSTVQSCEPGSHCSIRSARGALVVGAQPHGPARPSAGAHPARAPSPPRGS